MLASATTALSSAAADATTLGGSVITAVVVLTGLGILIAVLHKA